MILQRVALYPQMRLDVPDARAIEAFGQNDWKYFLSGIISAKSLVISGFEITNYPNIFTVPGVKLQLNNVSLIHPEATTQAAGFYVSSGTEPDANLILNPSTTNFVELDLKNTPGTRDVRAFWDPGANGGEGGEFTDTVDTVINLDLDVLVNVSGFTSGRIALYKIVTNSSGVVTEVTDCRPLFFRLGSGGTSPDPDHEATFPNLPDVAHAQFETPVKATQATTSNAPFQGGDKNLRSLKQWMDVVMTLLKTSNGVPYWYMKPQASLAGAYQNAASCILSGGSWEHLGKSAKVTATTTNTVTVQTGTLFASGPSTFKVGSTVYNYSAYDSSTGVFSGVTPSSTAIPIGSYVQQGSIGHLELDSGSVLVRFGQANSTLTAFSDIDLTTYRTLFTILSNNGSAIGYTMGEDGTTPIVPKSLMAITNGSLTVATGGNFRTSGGKIMARGQEFSYTSYNSSTGLFLGVSPDPTGLLKTGDTVYQAASGTTAYYHVSDSADVPGVVDGVSEGAERVFWIAYFDGNNTIFIRDSELLPGESAAVGSPDPNQIYAFVGSSGPNDAFPVYNVSSISNGTSLVDAIGAAFTIMETPIYDEKLQANASNITLAAYTSGSVVDGPALFGGGTPTYSLDHDAINGMTPPPASAFNTGPLSTLAWQGNNFTVGAGFVLGKITVVGGSPQGVPTGNVILDVYASSGNIPTGPVLASSDPVLASSLSLNTNADFTFSAAGFPALPAGNYVWMARGTTTDAGNAARLRSTGTPPAAPHGQAVATTNGGSTYSTVNYTTYYQTYSATISGGFEVAQGQGFLATASGSAVSSKFKMKKIGSPNLSLIAEIRANNSGVPGAVIATSGPVLASSIGTSFADVTFNFSGGVLTNSSIYHVTVRVSGSPTLHNAANDIILGKVTGNPYSGGAPSSSTDAGVSWSAQSGYDLYFQVTGMIGMLAGDMVVLPINQKTSTPGAYTMGTDELEVYENGVLLQKDYDYTELTNSSIQLSRDVFPGSVIRFRIASVGGAGAAAGGGPTGVSLQAAYSNGATIVTAPGVPFKVMGPTGQKIAVFQGDIDVTGVIDPDALTLTPQLSCPIAAGLMGFWVDENSLVHFRRPNGTDLNAGEILETLASSAPNLSRQYQNSTGATIPAGTPVYSPATGLIDRADAMNDQSSRVIGFTKQTIPDGEFGEVIIFGVVPGIMQGSGIAHGSYIWLQTVPGTYSSSNPTAPLTYQMRLGIVDGNDLLLQIQSFGQL